METADTGLSFIYDAHPLDFQDATHIRLLEPIYDQTYSSDDPPELRMQSTSYRLHIFSLEDAPPFAALSYAWGPPENTKTIDLEGNLFEVRKNLWDFLSYCEPQEHRKYLWIDALCINQTSVRERNHQVAIMGRIYRRAAMVIAWLGLGYDEALNLIPNALEDMIAEFGPDINIANLEWKVVQVATERSVLRSYFHAISKSDYWSRLWIVQEYVVNPILRVGSGRALLNIDATIQRFESASCQNLFPMFSLYLLYPTTHRVIYSRQLHATREIGWSVWYESHRLIRAFKGFKCADVRDRVFGLVGLFKEEELRVYPITVDYTQSVKTLFLKMFERQKQQGLLVRADLERYYLAEFADDLREALELPPDFGLEDGIPSWKLRRRSRVDEAQQLDMPGL
jgi:hypothetical protein